MYLGKWCRFGGSSAFPIARLSANALPGAVQQAASDFRSDVELWKAFAARTTDLMTTLRPQQISKIMFIFAKMRYRDKEMLQKMTAALPLCSNGFSATDIAFLLSACIKLNYNSKIIFTVLSKRIAQRLNDFSGEQLSRVLHAYATFGFHHPHVMAVMQRRFFEIHTLLNPQSLCLIANSYARLKLKDERFFALLTAEICRQIGDFSLSNLAVIANAYARLNVRSVYLLEVLAEEVHKKYTEKNQPKDVALILNALARLELPSPLLFKYFEKDIPKRLKVYNLQSICLVAAAYAKMKHPASYLFECMGERIGHLSKKLQPRSVALLIHAYAKMEHRYGPLFYHAPLHVERFIRDYTMDELACIMHGYARLNISHFSLFDILCERLSYLLEVYEANMKKSEIVSSSLPSKESLSNFVDPLATADIALAEETTEFNTMAIKRKKMEPLSTVLIELHSPKHISKQRQKHVCTESFIRILSSMSQFHLSNEKIFLSLGNILCHRIASLRPQDIRKIVSSYSQCHYYPPSFMAALLLRFNEAPIHWLIAYTQEDLKRLYISLSSLGFNPSKLGIYKLWTIEDDAEASSTGKYEEPNEYRTVLSKMLEELEAATQSTFRELQVPEQREFACIPYEIRHKVLSENNSESFLDLCDGNEWQTYNFIASH